MLYHRVWTLSVSGRQHPPPPPSPPQAWTTGTTTPAPSTTAAAPRYRGRTQVSIRGRTQVSIRGRTQVSIRGRTQVSIRGRTQVSMRGWTQVRVRVYIRGLHHWSASGEHYIWTSVKHSDFTLLIWRHKLGLKHTHLCTHVHTNIGGFNFSKV